MKKLFIYAAATATALTVTSFMPSAAYAAGTYNISGQKGNMISIGGNFSGNGSSFSCDGNFQGIPGINIAENDIFSSITNNGNKCDIHNTVHGAGKQCKESGWNIGNIQIEMDKPGNIWNGSQEGSRPEGSRPGNSQTGNDRPESSRPGSGQSGTNSTQDEFASQVVKLVNQERAKAGLGVLAVNTSAAKAAQTRAREIATSFSHTRPDGSSFSTALDSAGANYSQAGENIAAGQKSPEEVMEAWMNSAGHRANILNESFTEIGVGHYKDASGKDCWTQLFMN